MRMITLARLVGIAGVERPLILACATVEERAERGRDDPSKVENAGARIFEGGGHTDHFVHILCIQGWVKRL